MITVRVVVDSDDCLIRCDSEGHADHGGRGNDIVCSAVTVLVRTAAETHGGRLGSGLEWESPERGIVRFRISTENRGSGDRGWERGVADFLTSGLLRISRECPDHVVLNIQRK